MSYYDNKFFAHIFFANETFKNSPKGKQHFVVAPENVEVKKKKKKKKAD